MLSWIDPHKYWPNYHRINRKDTDGNTRTPRLRKKKSQKSQRSHKFTASTLGPGGKLVKRLDCSLFYCPIPINPHRVGSRFQLNMYLKKKRVKGTDDGVWKVQGYDMFALI